jgi:hypothetical protein
MKRENELSDEVIEHGPVYLAIERALWVLGPALILFMLLNVPAMRAAQEQAEVQLAADVSAENLEYCARWGMPAGTAQYLDCIRDLVAIRARAEQRLRDSTAAFEL